MFGESIGSFLDAISVSVALNPPISRSGRKKRAGAGREMAAAGTVRMSEGRRRGPLLHSFTVCVSNSSPNMGSERAPSSLNLRLRRTRQAIEHVRESVGTVNADL